MNEKKASIREWAALWEAKAQELRRAAAAPEYVNEQGAPGRGWRFRLQAAFYEAAARAGYEAAYEYGLVPVKPKAEKRWRDAQWHVAQAEKSAA